MPHRPHRVEPGLLAFSRELRQNSAPAEKIVWACLRNRQVGGCKFRRQYAVLGFVLDYFCPECKLAIELDGDSHSDRADYDEARTKALEGAGLKVLRFQNTDVFDNLDAVLNSILEECAASVKLSAPRPSPRLSPAYRGEEEGLR